MSSRDLFARAERVLPGGVSSPVRAFRSVGGSPIAVRDAHGACLTDLDGRTYTDYLLSWGALLLGHDAPEIRGAVVAAVGRGTSYGLTSPAEVDLAELIAERVPSVEVIRFVVSGTEATMSAVRLARAATGRDLIIKFDGGYHGHADSFLVSAGSGVATFGLPNSPGVPAALARLTLTCPFNDADAVRDTLDRHSGQVAAIIVEPFLGNVGFIPPASGFLAALRALADQAGALLIFDEVITGFRVHPGGAQGLTGVTPDLTTLGKIIGGGFPVGAYGGRRALMEMVAPGGNVYQAGTLAGNPVAMAAGLAALHAAGVPGFYETLERRTRTLVEGLRAAADAQGVPLTAAHAGSLWGFYFHPGPVTDYASARECDTARFARFHTAARERGVLLAPSAFEAAFVSAAHTDEIIADTVARLADALAVSARG